jgi:hypothetical protein
LVEHNYFLFFALCRSRNPKPGPPPFSSMKTLAVILGAVRREKRSGATYLAYGTTIERPPTRPSVYNANQKQPAKMLTSTNAVTQNQTGLLSL